MDDTLPMSLRDRPCHLFDEASCPHRGPWRAVKLLVKTPPRHIFQLEKWQTIGVADVADLDD